jgi:predicted enzyme related to lactoylglutathione lyase
MTTWLGQYCINVTDLDRTVGFYEALGLECTSRTEIEHALEAIIEHPGKGSKMQLAQQKDQDGPIDMGSAMWKLYVNTDDIEGTFAAALAAGGTTVSAGDHRVRRRSRRLPGRARRTAPLARRLSSRLT